MSSVFNSKFDPILLPGETARLITESGVTNIRCVAVGALPSYTYDFGAMTASIWNSDKENTNLEMQDFQLAQFRMMVLNDVKVSLNNLGSTKQWRTAKADFYLEKYPEDTGEDFLKEYVLRSSEFFVFGDDTPRFSFYPESALTSCSVRFMGWKFQCKAIPEPGKIDILVSGWPSGSGR